MKRLSPLAAVIVVMLFAMGALADTPAGQGKASQAKAEPKAAPASVTLKGEIVDTGCYISHGAAGEKHTLELRRDGKKRKVTVKLKEMI